MKLFSTLREKPWIQQPVTAMGPSQEVLVIDRLNAARLILRFIMAMVSVLFFLFIITFLSRSQYPDFQALAGQPWQPFTDATRLWINTSILLAASIAIQYGVHCARESRINGTVVGVSCGAFFSVLFLVAQIDLWQHLYAMGFYVSANPANSYFYLLTGVHGIHLLGGMIVLANVVFKVWYDEEADALSGPLQLCANYWHFLLVVWMVLFALLTSRSETINALAAMCGF